MALSGNQARNIGLTHIVGLGASAGGLEALESFFSAMPPNSGLSFVVVQHLSPDYESLMDTLLARKTSMKVMRVEDGMEVRPNCIYLIPPKKNMILFQNQLLLTDQERGHTINLPIDIFLRSLAENQKENAVGIILSGTGSDGMSGVRAVKENGGLVIAQDQMSAKFDGMPASAVSTGLVDYILPPDEMAEQLLRYISHSKNQPTETAFDELTQDEKSLNRIFGLLQHETGVDFSCYKINTVIRRIERRMRINQVTTLQDYSQLVGTNSRELANLYKELFIGVTNFFRDPEVFELLQEKVIPDLVKNGPKEEGLRIWCAGCSTGEEAYSLAIMLLEEMRRQNIRREVKIFATDLDKDAMEFAMAGAYPESIAADVSEERLNMFFSRKGGTYHVNRQLREMVIFARHNLLKDPPFTRVDLISCRNLLIYLNSHVQKKILSYFDFSLRPQGFLLLGTSETVGEMLNHFETVDTKAKVYRSVGGKRLPREMPSLGVSRDRMTAMTPRHHTQGFLANERRSEPFYQAVISGFVPPGLVVDEKFEIVHIFRDVSQFTRLPEGRLTTNLLSVVHEGIRTSLSTALHKAQKSNEHVRYRNIEYMQNDETYQLDLAVQSFDDRSAGERFFLVFFENYQQQESAPASEEIDARSTRTEMAKDLERELQFTKENLQATIEELETSNEELQATNEELVSSNEELQSTNEELQSVNEELHTVNSEYQNKIQELISLNMDIDNLMQSLEVATVFLDGGMCIRKFSTTANRFFNIRSQDIGRPLNDLTHKLSNEVELVDEILKANQEKQLYRREVRTETGEWLLMMIAPYPKENDSHRKDSVISFIDISTLKKAETGLRQSKAKMTAIFDFSEASIIECDQSGTILRVSPEATRMLPLVKESRVGTKLDNLFASFEDEEESRISDRDLPYKKVLKTGEPAFYEALKIRNAVGNLTQVRAGAKPLLSPDGVLESVLIVLHADSGED